MDAKELEREMRQSPVLNHMVRVGIPLTRENYLDLAYMGKPPKELSAEEEMQIPEILREEKGKV